MAAMELEESAQTALTCPVLFVVDSDLQARARTEAALTRRFGPDYSVLLAESASSGLAALERLAAAGTPVALVAADLHLPDGDGVEFLERVAGLHRGVARILLFDLDEFHTRIPFRELPALQRGSALGRIDGWW